MNCFSFDIETVPDIEFGRQLYGLEGLEDGRTVLRVSLGKVKASVPVTVRGAGSRPWPNCRV